MYSSEHPAIAKGTEISIGDLRGTMFVFEKAGDIVPKHAHEETNAHITIVARGKIKAYSHDWEKEVTAGQLIDFPAEQPHEFMALEDNTRIFNIVKKFGGVSDDTRY
jgi:quercetin dioxygenase-like cupin family protein